MNLTQIVAKAIHANEAGSAMRDDEIFEDLPFEEQFRLDIAAVGAINAIIEHLRRNQHLAAAQMLHDHMQPDAAFD